MSHTLTDDGLPQPDWWTSRYDTLWDRVRSALRRDWEQTKSDLAGRGAYLDQNLGDTLRQAAGEQPIPPDDMPTERELPDWLQLEDAIRYGFAARQRNPEASWDEMAPALEREWHTLHNHLGWTRAKIGVWFGWSSNRGSMI